MEISKYEALDENAKIETTKTDVISENMEKEAANSLNCNKRGVLIVVAGFCIHLTFGTVFTYGNLSPYMISYIRRRSSPADLRYVDGIWVQACMMIGQGVTMFAGGLLERKLGPRITTLIGSWTMSGGVLISFFAVKHSYIATVFTLGVMFGMGVGLAYPIPIGCATKWLPERIGLVSAVMTAAFSAGAVVFNQVIAAFINPHNYSPDTDVYGEQYFSQDDLLDQVPLCFLLLGGVFAFIQLVCCLVLVDPPQEHKVTDKKMKIEQNMNKTKTDKDKDKEEKGISCTDYSSCKDSKDTQNERSVEVQDINPLQVLKTRNFYILWLIFLCGGEGVVFISSQYKNYGQTFIADDLFHAIVGSVSSVVSAVGCIFWGMILDRFTFKITAGCIYAGFTAVIASFIGSEYAGKPMFFIWVCLLFFFFAGVFTIMPPAISRLYGNTYVGVNFGLLFTSQIITGATSAFLGQILKDSIGWHGLFYLSTGFSALGFVLVFSWIQERQREKDFKKKMTRNIWFLRHFKQVFKRF